MLQGSAAAGMFELVGGLPFTCAERRSGRRFNSILSPRNPCACTHDVVGTGHDAMNGSFNNARGWSSTVQEQSVRAPICKVHYVINGDAGNAFDDEDEAGPISSMNAGNLWCDQLRKHGIP